MVNTADPVSNLRDLRDSIDNIDAAIVYMLAERFRCTRAVGKLKAHHGLPARDPGREAEQVSRLRQLAAVSTLDPDFAEKFWPLSFVNSFAITKRFRAQPPKIYLGMSRAEPRVGGWRRSRQFKFHNVLRYGFSFGTG
jgi:chorismate mutase